MGRFITPDWFVPTLANPQDFNRYAYARNNPLIYTDPTGNFPAWLGWLLVGLIVGKAIADGQAAEKAGKNFWGGFGKSLGVSVLALAAAATAAYIAAAILPAGSTTAGLLQGTLKLINWAGEGAAAGLAANTVTNAGYNRPLGENAGKAAGLGALFNVGLRGINEAVKGFKNSAGANARKSLDDAGLGRNANNRGAELKIGEQLPDGIMPASADDGINSTLDRISKGIKFAHKNDGSIFLNKEGLLPKQSAGYYREYVVPTPGTRGAGLQRIVTGQQGETFYTPDHYKSFTRLKVDVQK